MENAPAITNDNSMISNPEEPSSLQSGGSYERVIVQNDSVGSQSTVQSNQGQGLVCPPMSPQRSNHNSVPPSPVRQQIPQMSPQQLSPIPVTLPNLKASKIENPFDTPNVEYTGSNAVLLGMQQLERQQAAMGQQQQQQRSQQQAVLQQQQQQQQQRHYSPPSDDDDHTEPSSTVSRNTGENPAGYTRTDTDAATSTFGKIIQNTRVSHSLAYCLLGIHDSLAKETQDPSPISFCFFSYD
jgi:hypothetical protein